MTAAELRALAQRVVSDGRTDWMSVPAVDIIAALDDAERVATERVTAPVAHQAAKATAVYNDPAIRTGYHEGRMDALNELLDALRESAKGGG